MKKNITLWLLLSTLSSAGCFENSVPKGQKNVSGATTPSDASLPSGNVGNSSGMSPGKSVLSSSNVPGAGTTPPVNHSSSLPNGNVGNSSGMSPGKNEGTLQLGPLLEAINKVKENEPSRKVRKLLKKLGDLENGQLNDSQKNTLESLKTLLQVKLLWKNRRGQPAISSEEKALLKELNNIFVD